MAFHGASRGYRGIRVSVTGATGEDSIARGFIEREIERNAGAWSKFSRINLLEIRVERRSKGGRPMYSVGIEATGNGSFHADASDWGMEKTVSAAFGRLGRELVRKKEKSSFGRFRRIMPRRG